MPKFRIISYGTSIPPKNRRVQMRITVAVKLFKNGTGKLEIMHIDPTIRQHGTFEK